MPEGTVIALKLRMILLILCAVALCFGGCAAPPAAVPDRQEEIRAMWVPYMEMQALLGGKDAAAARAAITQLMQDCADRGVNTVYVHVRSHSDAYYRSDVFAPHPTAAALLGEGVDPLACAVEEGHARGIAVHAWVNPYRIGADRTQARCEDVFSFEDRWYYVPTSPAVQQLIADGVQEIVNRYDVDGIQFDDYFYPEGAVEPTVRAAFEQELELADGETVADRRRRAVSELMRTVYAVCHTRAGCVFTVSPSYDLARTRERMYADVALWAGSAGFVDVLCPQLYIGLEHEYAPFEKALAEWTALRRDPSVSLVAGLALYKTGLEHDRYAGSGAAEWANGGHLIARQAILVRQAGWSGTALYSHSSLSADNGRDAAVVAAEIQAMKSLWNS